MPKAEEVSEEDIHPDKVDWAVETLCFSTAEQRPAVASNLRLFLTETGGVKMLWDQLCRHRKSEGAQAGLKVLVEMLQVKDDPREMAGHEPAVEILARLCNDREYSAIIGKVRKLLPSLGNVLGDLKSTRRARESASWVMRRTSEFSRVSRADLGTNREVLNLVARILKFEDLAIVPVKAGGTLGGKMARKGAEPVVSRAASPSIANIKSSPLAANNNPPSAMVTFPGVTIAEPPTRKEAEMEDPHRAPGTAGGTRPGTSMTAFGPTQVITYTSEPDSMCVEGNLCAAIGNACHQDEVLERLGKTAGLMEATHPNPPPPRQIPQYLAPPQSGSLMVSTPNVDGCFLETREINFRSPHCEETRLTQAGLDYPASPPGERTSRAHCLRP
ncbi:hypothetical protein T484DRAFT_2097229 [Baffinella frigidus]|nr:hypothetical protein T484DRAFT_2097229 [Cryptophyta sp. CCMP2293]